MNPHSTGPRPFARAVAIGAYPWRMAEIRKHNPNVANPIDQALLAALGEPVKPVQPGAKAKPAQPVEDDGTKPGAVSVTGITLGEGQWLQVERSPFKGFGTQPVEPKDCEES